MEDLKIVAKCENTILADEIKNALEAAEIPCMAVDETITGAMGGYGPMPGIAIKVYKKDLEKAKDIVSKIQEERQKKVKLWCPTCGSEEVELIQEGVKNSIYWKRVGALLLALTIIWLLFYLPSPKFTIIVTIIVALIGLIILPKTRSNYHCKNCGKDFYK